MNDTAQPLSSVEPTDARARIALRAALAMLVPLARWLVRNGVHYASFAPALKTVFVEAARRELAEHDGKLTDSALSVLSGVHRRDIRAMGESSPTDAQPKTPSVASQVFTRWLTDPQLRDAHDQPAAMPKSGDALSFDGLARQISSDVHPRTLLAEMQRLGLVQVDGDLVRLQAQAFVPQQGFEEMTDLFAANVGDHLAAAAHNLRGAPDKFLEQSIFGSGLSTQSTEQLGARGTPPVAERLPADGQRSRATPEAGRQETRDLDAHALRCLLLRRAAGRAGERSRAPRHGHVPRPRPPQGAHDDTHHSPPPLAAGRGHRRVAAQRLRRQRARLGRHRRGRPRPLRPARSTASAASSSAASAATTSARASSATPSRVAPRRRSIPRSSSASAWNSTSTATPRRAGSWSRESRPS